VSGESFSYFFSTPFFGLSVNALSPFCPFEQAAARIMKAGRTWFLF
jgi:hypothetical protein